MSNIESILKIIDLSKGITKKEVADFFVVSRATLYNKPILTNDQVEAFAKKYYTQIIDAGFRVIDNYDVFGYIGKAIVKEGDVLFGGKYKEVEKKLDNEKEEGVNSGSRDQDPYTFLELIAKKQQALASEIESFLKDASGSPSKLDNQRSSVKSRRQKLADTPEEKDKQNKGKGKQHP